ncbi:MAG: hypothetical protein M3Y57_20080 [Acidobacteriota bacterium]|nr:hypothetical protein [Acidobacteriota bacterium]
MKAGAWKKINGSAKHCSDRTSQQSRDRKNLRTNQNAFEISSVLGGLQTINHQGKIAHIAFKLAFLEL